ncbi:uncharacterized protein TNCV_2900621 [Trichonephila clavipes]|nr:uncharacterized protein TNCV_2900621 [Trichonephila clavipes]
MPDHRIFQRLHRQLCETRSFHITRHDSSRRRAVCCPGLKESVLNIVADEPDSSTRALAHHVNVSYQTVCVEY